MIFSRSSTELMSSCFICSANCCSLAFRSEINFSLSGVFANAAVRSSTLEIALPVTVFRTFPAMTPIGPARESALPTNGAAFFRNPRMFGTLLPLESFLQCGSVHLVEIERSHGRADRQHAVNNLFDLREKLRRLDAAETWQAKSTRLIRMRANAHEVAVDLAGRLRRGNSFLRIRGIRPKRSHSLCRLIRFQSVQRPGIHVAVHRAIAESDRVGENCVRPAHGLIPIVCTAGGQLVARSISLLSSRMIRARRSDKMKKISV